MCFKISKFLIFNEHLQYIKVELNLFYEILPDFPIQKTVAIQRSPDGLSRLPGVTVTQRILIKFFNWLPGCMLHPGSPWVRLPGVCYNRGVRLPGVWYPKNQFSLQIRIYMQKAISTAYKGSRSKKMSKK